MKEPKKSPVGYAALFFAITVLLCLIALICLSTVEASAKEPEFTSLTKAADGECWEGHHLYIIKNGKIQTGWVKLKVGRKTYTYYCHKTDSRKYPRGSATRGEMRIKNGKFYAFAGADCRMITEDYYLRYGPVKKRLSLKINRDKSVRYVYNTAAINRNKRYSTAKHRLQICGIDNRWRSVGMRYWPDYVDWQK